MDITNIMFRNFRSTVKLHHFNCALTWPISLMRRLNSEEPSSLENNQFLVSGMANSMPPKLSLFSLEIPELGLDRRITLGKYENA